MKKVLCFLFVVLIAVCMSDIGFAKGGFSSGGGRGGFSSGGFSGGSRGFSGGSSRSYSGSSSSSRSYSSSPSRSTTTTTTISRNYYGGGMGYYYHPYMMYPGFGMGYGYSNGLMEGLIIGSLMHPAGTTVYSGGGYGGNALLYPDGRVVDQNGYQVGTYINGQFTPVQNGQMIAQQAPPQGQPVAVTTWTEGEIALTVIGGIGCVVLLFFAIVLI